MEKNTTDLLRPLKVIVLTFGPLLTLALLARTNLPLQAGEREMLSFVALLLWSPLFFSIPAFMMAEQRDRFRGGAHGTIQTMTRGLLLVPAMLSRPGRNRVEMSASLTGFGLAFVAALPQLQVLVGLL